MSIDDLGEADPLEEKLLIESPLGFFDLLRGLSLEGLLLTPAWVWSCRMESDDDMA
jgi:hypothetical protein